MKLHNVSPLNPTVHEGLQSFYQTSQVEHLMSHLPLGLLQTRQDVSLFFPVVQALSLQFLSLSQQGRHLLLEPPLVLRQTSDLGLQSGLGTLSPAGNLQENVNVLFTACKIYSHPVNVLTFCCFTTTSFAVVYSKDKAVHSCEVAGKGCVLNVLHIKLTKVWPAFIARS